jgi:uncharacterized protein (UPF0264 family)
MMSIKPAGSGPGLLVSVRSADEALEALAGGADVIDVKEPRRGSLGAADAPVIAEVVRAVSARATVSAALGELVELESKGSDLNRTTMLGGVSLFKIGLSGCRENANWLLVWRDVIKQLIDGRRAAASRPVAVAYADWQAASAPEPMQVLQAAVEARCPALLVDTWDKSSGSLFKCWPPADLHCFAEEVRSHGIALVLAGSLMGAAVGDAARLGPDLIAVRTAACRGGRDGRVCRQLVRALKQSIAATRAA